MRGIRQWNSPYIAVLAASFMRVGRDDNLRSGNRRFCGETTQTKSATKEWAGIFFSLPPPLLLPYLIRRLGLRMSSGRAAGITTAN